MKEKEKTERELKGEKDSFENSDVCFNTIKDFHLQNDDNHVVPIIAVKMVKYVFDYTKSISYNKLKTENLMKELGLSICETCSSELRLSELAFLNFNKSGQHMISTVIHIDGKWKTFFHIFTGIKSEHEIFSEGSRFSHDLSKFELKSHDVYRDGGSYKKTYKSVSFILIFDYNKSTNITTVKAIPIKSSTPVLPGISVDVVDTQQFRGGGGSGRGR